MISSLALQRSQRLAQMPKLPLHPPNRPRHAAGVGIAETGGRPARTMPETPPRQVRRRPPGSSSPCTPRTAASTCEDLREQVDEIICAMTPEPFYAVGLWYEEFSQTTDQEVRELLSRRVHV